MKKIFLGMFIWLSVCCAAGAVDRAEPLDKWCDSCQAKAKCTGDEIECYEQAYKKWDQELNQQYRKLMAQLPADQKRVLQTSQLQWLKFRDQELKVIDAVYSQKSGSMYAPMQAASRSKLIRARALELKHYLEILNDI